MRKYMFPVLMSLAMPVFADTYTRQPEIDVVHYEINLELSDSSDTISATTRIHVMMRRDGVSHMWLDFAGMSVDRLTVSGKELPYQTKDSRLAFGLGRPYQTNEIAVVEVRYHGQPGGKGLLIGKNAHGRRVFFAENWPDDAHYWFPSIDHPWDKATVDFAITAPEKYDVVANGRLVETRSLLDGRKLTRWSEGVPIPTYCMVFGAAEFSIFHAGPVLDAPVVYYAYPEDADAAAHKFARTKLVVSYLSDLIGPYPYEKLAQVQSTTRIGGMENASNIFYSERSFQRTPVTEAPVPHETVHQWFGDSVTEADWDHLWISEGFATYFDALFYAHLEGPEALRSRMARSAEAVKKYHQTRPKPIIDPELTDLNKKLNAFNYQKGAWVLHMLRRVLGDDVFFAGIRRYYALYAGKNALTEDFQKVMESAGGVSLQKFFHQWFYQPGWPEYEVTWRWDEPAKEVEVVIRQVQKTGLFDMPLDVAVRTGAGITRHMFQVNAETNTFRIPANERPTAVEIDPDGWLLKSAVVRPN
jgi:aminopeptidase N